jgi:hypothetical protein
MAKPVGQDTSKSVTGFGATSPGQEGKNFQIGSKKAASTTAVHAKAETANPVGSSARFSKSGLGPSALGDTFRKLAERRGKSQAGSKTKTVEPGRRSGTNLNTNWSN